MAQPQGIKSLQEVALVSSIIYSTDSYALKQLLKRTIDFSNLSESTLSLIWHFYHDDKEIIDKIPSRFILDEWWYNGCKICSTQGCYMCDSEEGCKCEDCSCKECGEKHNQKNECSSSYSDFYSVSDCDFVSVSELWEELIFDHLNESEHCDSDSDFDY